MRPSLPPAHFTRIKAESVLGYIGSTEQQYWSGKRQPLSQTAIGRVDHSLVSARDRAGLGAAQSFESVMQLEVIDALFLQLGGG